MAKVYEIRKDIQMTVKEINDILPPSSRFTLREDEMNDENTNDKMTEYLFSLKSYLKGLRYAKDETEVNGVTETDTTCDAQIEEIAACYYIYNYLVKIEFNEPPQKFSSKQKERAKNILIDILSRKEFIYHGRVRVSDFPHLWENIPAYWKQYDEVVFAALHGKLICNPTPQVYPCLFDQQKLLKMLLTGIVEWTDLPSQIQSDESFIQKVLQDSQPLCMYGQIWICLMIQIFSECRDLFLDRNLWIQTLLPTCKQAIQCMDEDERIRGYEKEMIALLADLEPINAERELMSLAIEIDQNAFLYLHENLKNDNQFIHDNVKKFPGTLHMISNEWLIENKGLVMTEFLKKIKFSKSYDYHFSLTCLANKFGECGFWNDEEFTNKWFEQGFPLMHSHNPKNWSEEEIKEKLLSVTRNCGRRDYVMDSFRFASPALRSNIEFFRQAMQSNKYIIRSASKELQRNDRLMLDAIASSQSFTDFFTYHLDYDDDDEKYLLGLKSRLCTKLYVYDCFHIILCLISHVQPWMLLNQDEDTSMQYKKRIAECLDVPIGKELQLIRRAYEHLNRTFQN